ncbi:serine protease [Lacihabitans sp. CCS-44]|uniref:S1 family peptidase n=1 Tax=Lacihabitans sp. CCS-44 TaxID=2487331 RepID=UPI0020CEE01D|nr:serine protease [Lacihabitans sp. CCS-44]
MNTIKPHYLSLCTLKLLLNFNETELAIGTGFIYSHKEKLYLITNWHNVTGRNPSTHKRLTEKHGGFPNKILFKLRSRKNGADFYSSEMDLYVDEEHTIPNWLIHPIHKEKADVVAIEISFEEADDVLIQSLNQFVDFQYNLKANIADDVFVIGYPRGLDSEFILPIWKRGSIASEPDVNIDELPKILIDTITREGMSGSPVIFRQHSPIKTVGVLGSIYGFQGIYSGRIGDIDSIQLGYVWKKEVIEEIIDGATKASNEFQRWS